MSLKTRLVRSDKECEIDQIVLGNNLDSSLETIKMDMSGIFESVENKNGVPEIDLDIETAKRIADIGDFMFFRYDGYMIPFRVVHKLDSGNVILCSHYSLGSLEVRTAYDMPLYMNMSLIRSFDKSFVSAMKPSTTLIGGLKDKLFVPSMANLCKEMEVGMEHVSKRYDEPFLWYRPNWWTYSTSFERI